MKFFLCRTNAFAINWRNLFFIFTKYYFPQFFNNFIYYFTKNFKLIIDKQLKDLVALLNQSSFIRLICV